MPDQPAEGWDGTIWYDIETVKHPMPIIVKPKPKAQKKWKGWREITDPYETLRRGDVICLGAVGPASIHPDWNHKHFKMYESGGYRINGGGYQMDSYITRNRKGQQVRVWRKLPRMNPVFSKPLPLP